MKPNLFLFYFMSVADESPSGSDFSAYGQIGGGEVAAKQQLQSKA
jgi:hypothetical protein